ncbi:hypothetical protein CBR_g17786 [Chara braunii]|uniref:DUF659 domain-containing protein n=1 Tax=Chara braunii TaxID=69332 RepID=A0A388KVI3_CHABU|nr:hypothetical protein CBR_g17786 [Chara braunii]|eukprot:GBG74075.1 hypothetical protein CBR_g17786 [Chara braunii]
MNERTSRFLDRFFICTNQLFSLVEDVFFLEFLQAVRTAHPTWMPCRRDKQRTKRLDAEYARLGAEVRAMIVKWKKTGCMLQMDGWSDRLNKPHLNVMVSSPAGTVLWKSVYMEGNEKDSATYFRVLDDVIKEIGADAVVGVVMDNARVCMKAGKMVESAYPTIFNVGCTTHALDLMLEDMYKEMPWMAQVVDDGNKVGHFFSNVDKASALFHHYSPKTKLKRLAATRFATDFEMLQSLRGLRKVLDRYVCDKGLVDKMVRNDQLVAFHDVTAIVLDKGDFWRNLQKALDVMQPVVELLHLVDGQGATISKIYFKMDQVVQNLRALESLSVEEHEAVERILMGRWAFLTSGLHCAAAFLDPEHRMHNAQRDRELLRKNQCGEGDDTHIPWADDVPVDKEMEEWYVQWLDWVHKDVDCEEVVEVDCDDEGDKISMRRTFLRNDEVDDKLVEEEDTLLVGTTQRDWHECTKHGKHREQELRRKSGCQLPVLGELYTEEGYALAMEARPTGTWVQGRDEARTKRRGKDKGKHAGACKAKKAEEKAIAAAAEAKAAADKAMAAKARAAAKAATKSAGRGKAKKFIVVSDDDDVDVPEKSPEEDETPSSSHTSGMEGTAGEGSEGGAQFEDDKEEDQVEAE